MAGPRRDDDEKVVDPSSGEPAAPAVPTTNDVPDSDAVSEQVTEPGEPATTNEVPDQDVAGQLTIEPDEPLTTEQVPDQDAVARPSVEPVTEQPRQRRRGSEDG